MAMLNNQMVMMKLPCIWSKILTQQSFEAMVMAKHGEFKLASIPRLKGNFSKCPRIH